jgi:hypothetical protein
MLTEIRLNDKLIFLMKLFTKVKNFHTQDDQCGHLQLLLLHTSNIIQQILPNQKNRNQYE